MSVWRVCLLAVSIAAGVVLSASGTAHPAGPTGQAAPAAVWATNGIVNALAVRGKTLYIGGSFSQIGPWTGGLAAFSTSSGERDPRFPAVVGGGVGEVVGDGAGGWFVGGSFRTIGGVACPNLAHVNNDLTVDAGFCPRPDDAVVTIVASGQRLYVGGWFRRIGGQARAGLAVVDPASGSVSPWDARPSGHAYADLSGGPAVVAIAVSGARVYVAGDFALLGGKPRDGVGAVDATTAAPLAWAPEVGWDHNGYGVAELVATPNRVYGECRCVVGGQNREEGLLALDAQTAATLPWNPDADAGPLVLSGGTLYVGGPFTKIAGAPRRGLASFDAATGTLSSWDPSPRGQAVTALSISGSTVYAATRPPSTDSDVFSSEIEAFDASSGTESSWRPANANGQVSALTAAGNRVVAGGSFTGIGGAERGNLAAVDLQTGAVTPWRPVASGGYSEVESLAVSGSAVFLGGDFTRINRTRRNKLAAVDAATGATMAWAPAGTGDQFAQVKAIAVAGRTVYFGGDGIGLTAVDVRTGRRQLEPQWGYGDIDAITSTGAALVVGGESGLIVFRRSTREEMSAASVDYSVLAVEFVQGTIYAGGNFGFFEGRSRARLGALDARTRKPLVWNPRPDWNVEALRACGPSLYAGGLFATIGGARRSGLAAFDLRTRRLLTWNPAFLDADGNVTSLACAGSFVYAGRDGGVTAFRR